MYGCWSAIVRHRGDLAVHRRDRGPPPVAGRRPPRINPYTDPYTDEDPHSRSGGPFTGVEVDPFERLAELRAEAARHLAEHGAATERHRRLAAEVEGEHRAGRLVNLAPLAAALDDMIEAARAHRAASLAVVEIEVEILGRG